MNVKEMEILNVILNESNCNQCVLNMVDDSFSTVDPSIQQLIKDEYIDDSLKPTKKLMELSKENNPKNAIILAAGFGMRMVPINMDSPKGLLEVAKEPLIERIIKQLHEVDIHTIYIVTGYMKERYEYLKDLYDVELIDNKDYSQKNNLHSLSLVADKIDNSYIVPCDVWCEENVFRRTELYSWYMVSNTVDDDSTVRLGKNQKLYATPPGSKGNAMIGICYLSGKEASLVRNTIVSMANDSVYDGEYWECALYNENTFIVPARVVGANQVKDVNTFEHLRELDRDSNCLKSDAIQIVADVFHVKEENITGITVLKKGMTNRSFLFEVNNKKYIMRIPGEGTEKLIQRKQEADVYAKVDGQNLCDDVVYMNPNNGYKITVFFEDVRTCDPDNVEEVSKCMRFLKQFHSMELTVDHTFDIYSKIEFYESLWNGTPSIYKDYRQTKENAYQLKTYIESHIDKKVLTHIDAVCDNFLFIKNNGKEEIRLIDWEYAGMQDPHVDIAMFAIYALYDRQQVDQLIDLYFENTCKNEIRIKIYCYIAICGLLWSNWCEYKRVYGIEFGEYAHRQYNYAKDYYKIVQDELKKNGDSIWKK